MLLTRTIHKFFLSAKTSKSPAPIHHQYQLSDLPVRDDIVEEAPYTSRSSFRSPIISNQKNETPAKENVFLQSFKTYVNFCSQQKIGKEKDESFSDSDSDSGESNNLPENKEGNPLQQILPNYSIHDYLPKKSSMPADLVRKNAITLKKENTVDNTMAYIEKLNKRLNSIEQTTQKITQQQNACIIETEKESGSDTEQLIRESESDEEEKQELKRSQVELDKIAQSMMALTKSKEYETSPKIETMKGSVSKYEKLKEQLLSCYLSEKQTIAQQVQEKDIEVKEEKKLIFQHQSVQVTPVIGYMDSCIQASSEDEDKNPTNKHEYTLPLQINSGMGNITILERTKENTPETKKEDPCIKEPKICFQALDIINVNQETQSKENPTIHESLPTNTKNQLTESTELASINIIQEKEGENIEEKELLIKCENLKNLQICPIVEESGEFNQQEYSDERKEKAASKIQQFYRKILQNKRKLPPRPKYKYSKEEEDYSGEEKTLKKEFSSFENCPISMARGSCPYAKAHFGPTLCAKESNHTDVSSENQENIPEAASLDNYYSYKPDSSGVNALKASIRKERYSYSNNTGKPLILEQI